MKWYNNCNNYKYHRYIVCSINLRIIIRKWFHCMSCKKSFFVPLEPPHELQSMAALRSNEKKTEGRENISGGTRKELNYIENNCNEQFFRRQFFASWLREILFTFAPHKKRGENEVDNDGYRFPFCSHTASPRSNNCAIWWI